LSVLDRASPEALLGATETRAIDSGVLASGRGFRGARAQIPVPSALLLAVTTSVVLAAELWPRLRAVDPSAHSAIETVIALSAIATFGLLLWGFRRDREWRALLLLCAVVGLWVADFAGNLGLSLLGSTSVQSDDSIWLGCELIAGVTFASAALSPPDSIAGSSRELARFAVVLGVGSAVLAGLLFQVTTVGAESSSVTRDDHAIALGIHAMCAVLMALAALGFLMARRSTDGGSGMLAGASVLLAGANLQYLVMRTPNPQWLTPREGLRLGAWVFLLGYASLRQIRRARRERYAAICFERERLARDLHDGLAQDLACIAVQAQRLDCALEPEDPLMLAVRQAVAVTRGMIADLTASTAPSTEAALRVIADELGHRFNLQVEVRFETDAEPGPDGELDPAQREHLIRIAREAIVNAALHGTARRVDVVLLRRERSLLLRVCDDGSGIAEGDRSGFGLRTMRAHAASLGGHLNAYPRVGGGTELELRVS
jgi:signal transduction histidine kinase